MDKQIPTLLDREFRKHLQWEAERLFEGHFHLTTRQRSAFLRLETALMAVDIAMLGLDHEKLVKEEY